jgi:lysophospholipase L1-like esterase
VNAGNNGFTSIQTSSRFYTKVLPLRPTHVILYLGPNDIYATGPDRLLITGASCSTAR